MDIAILFLRIRLKILVNFMHLRVKITLFMTESSQFKVENHLNQKFNWSHRQMMLNGILNAANKLYCHDIYVFFFFVCLFQKSIQLKTYKMSEQETTAIVQTFQCALVRHLV